MPFLRSSSRNALDPTREDIREHYHLSNSTITSTVVLRVTPKEDFPVSWGILWGLFVLTSIFGAWQVWKESRLLSSRRATDDPEQMAEGASTADFTRGIVRTFDRLSAIYLV
jgi:hypothetical protein